MIDLAREHLQTSEGCVPLLLSLLADYRGFGSPHEFISAVWRQRVGTADMEVLPRSGGLFLLVDSLNEMPDPGPLRDDESLPPSTTGWEEPTLMAAGLANDPQPLIEVVRFVNPVLAARCLTERGIGSAPGGLGATQDALLADMANRRSTCAPASPWARPWAVSATPSVEGVEVEGIKVVLPSLVDIPAGEATRGSSCWEVWRFARKGFPAGNERPRLGARTGLRHGPIPGHQRRVRLLRRRRRLCGRALMGHGPGAGLVAGGAEGELCKDWLNTWRAVKADPSIMRRWGWSEVSIAQWNKGLALDEAQIWAALEERGADCGAPGTIRAMGFLLRITVTESWRNSIRPRISRRWRTKWVEVMVCM